MRWLQVTPASGVLSKRISHGRQQAEALARRPGRLPNQYIRTIGMGTNLSLPAPETWVTMRVADTKLCTRRMAGRRFGK